MRSRRSANDPRFECRACGNWVHPVTYRAACPLCGGRLRPVRATAPRSTIDGRGSGGE